jgi:hypothetical protein
MNRAIGAVWGAAFVTLVASGIEFYDGEVMSGAIVLLVAVGLAALAYALTQRYA